MDVTVVPSEAELNQLLRKTFTSHIRSDYITVNGFILPERYRLYEKNIKEFEVRDTDVWITGFPKTGTTWISEIAWLILNDFDYEQAKNFDYDRTRILEFSMLFDTDKEILFDGHELEFDSIGYTAKQKDPRSIKTHLPFTLLPEEIQNGAKKPRIIYTARNPMDTCISYYHHCTSFEGFSGTFEEFCSLFLFDKINYGSYANHVLSFWEHRNEPNVLFLTYEEMKKNISVVIQRVANFLGKTVSQEDGLKLEQYVSFDSMKRNPAVNKENTIKDFEDKGIKMTPFIRVGKAGGYKDTMSPFTIDQFRYIMGKRFEHSGLNLLDN